jgi:TonB family protein
MDMFETEELSDNELSEMLATWTVQVPSAELRSRLFCRLPFSHAVTYAAAQPVWGIVSVAAHCAVVLLALFAFQSAKVQIKLKNVTDIYFPVNAYKPKSQQAAGGGGGGQKALTPVAKGAAPRFAPRQFLPPAIAVPKPLLAVTPTITAPAPQITAENYGDPLSKLAGTSPGHGLNGFGNGAGGGLGNGNGDGFGDGTGGGTYKAGGEVSSPILLSKVEPEYSEEARRAKYSGTVSLSVVVDEQGIPRDIKVVRPLGLGLDERAIQAVARWRFRPGTKNGHPVKVRATVEVSFRLL